MADINISKLKLPNDNNTYHYKDTVSGYKSTDATQSEHGLLSTTDKIKLDGIATGAEVNQNAFSNVKVGSTTVAADSKTDTLELVAGTNVTLTPDATNDKVTITAKDTTYSDATTSASGLMSASDKTKLNGIASGAEVNQNAFSNVVVGSTTVAADSKTDTLTLVGGANITLTPDATNDKITILLDDTVDTGEVIATDVQAGNLIVNGTSRFLNTINGTASDSEKLNGQSLTSTYSSTGTAPITGTAVASAIGALDGTVTGSPSASKTLTAFSQTDGKVSATFGNISITKSQVSDFPTLGTAAAKNYTTSVSSGSADLVTSGAVWTAIDNLPEPMVFKGSLGTGGTITALPVDGTAKVGDTYKVITAGTYASKAAKVGDTFICLTKTSSANTWELIPSGDEPSGTVTSVGISNGGGLSVSGSPITSSGTITISHSDTSSQASVSNSGRTYIQSITLDTYGHVTKLTSATETVTNTDRYVNSAAFAYDSTNDNVKMTLTRAGSDTATVTANIPKVSSSSSGVVPKGATVSSQSQTTKFLREDGTWATPSYTTNTNTTYTLGTSGNTVTLTPSSGNVQSITVPYATTAGALLTGSASGDTHAAAIKAYFDANKSTVPRNKAVSLYSTAYSNGSQYIGYYLSSYDSTPYGGFFVAHYNKPFYIGIQSGTYTEYKLARISSTPTNNQVVIADGTEGILKTSGYTIGKSVPSNAVFTDTTYTIGTSDNNVTLTPSSGSVQTITVPYATSAGSATDNTKVAKAGDTMTGILKAQQGVYSHGCGSSGGTAGYFKFATITVTTGYVNRPIILSIVRRNGRETLGTVVFSNTSLLTPSLNLYYNGDFTLFYVKTGDSTWDLYVGKGEPYGNVYFNIINPGQLISGGVTWEWTDSTVAELPEGYVTATVETRTLNITGTASNVTGTVAIANGGTGATSRLAAAKNLTDETVPTPGFVVGLTDSWGKFGYTSIANLKTTIGSASAASGGTAITMCTTGEKYTWNNKLNLSGGTMTGDLTVGVNGSSYPKSYVQLKYSTSDPSIGITYQPSSSSVNSSRLDKTGVIVSQNSSSLNIKYNDLEFSASSNPPTWDGTNTSLVTAVTSAKDTVKQYVNSTNGALDVILSGSASGGGTGTGYVYKSSNLTFNPAYSNATMTSGLLCVNGKSTSNVNYSLKMYSNDIVLSGTSSTWDGTNTSLVTAVTQLKNTKADILAETIASLTFSSGVATLAKKEGYILINVYPYNRTDDGYGITSFTEQTNGSYKIRNNTTSLSASLSARAIWLKV